MHSTGRFALDRCSGRAVFPLRRLTAESVMSVAAFNGRKPLAARAHMVRTDPGSLSRTTLARIGSRGNRLPDRPPGSPCGHAVLEDRPRLRLNLIATTGVQAGRGRPVHAGRPAEALEDADDAGGDIDLPGIGAMPGAGGIGMVHVVPALAEGEQGERPQVGGAVVPAGSEGPGADHVAQRVDAPGDVLEQGDADQSGTPQRG